MNEFGKMLPTRLAQVIPLKGDTKSSAQYAPRLPVAPNDRGRFGARDSVEQMLTTASRSRVRRAFVKTLRQSPAPALPAVEESAPLAGLHHYHREHERHDPAGLPQREALAGRADGAAGRALRC